MPGLSYFSRAGYVSRMIRPPSGATIPGLASERDIYSISRLNREAKALLEGSFPLLWIEGEISNLARPSSGHL